MPVSAIPRLPGVTQTRHERRRKVAAFVTVVIVLALAGAGGYYAVAFGKVTMPLPASGKPAGSTEAPAKAVAPATANVVGDTDDFAIHLNNVIEASQRAVWQIRDADTKLNVLAAAYGDSYLLAAQGQMETISSSMKTALREHRKIQEEARQALKAAKKGRGQ